MDLRKLHHTKAKQVKVSTNPPINSDGQNGDMQLIRSSNVNNNELLYIKINDEWKIIGLEDRPDFASQRTVPNIEKIKYKDSNVIDISDTSLTIDRALTVSGAITGNLTGNVTGNVSGTAATVTGAAQANITSLGTLTTLTVDDITINGSTISDAGNFFIDVEDDIYLNANGGDIFFKDDTSTAFQFNLDTDPLELDVYDNFKLDVDGDITLDAGGGDIFGTYGAAEFMHYNYAKHRTGYTTGTTDSSGNAWVSFDTGDAYDATYGLYMVYRSTQSGVFGLFCLQMSSSGNFSFDKIFDKGSALTLTEEAAHKLKIAGLASSATNITLVQLGGGTKVTGISDTA